MSHLALPMLLGLLGTACLEEDFDADGFGVSEDCDDHRSTINPDVADTCNGIDDDCDGVIDQNATAADPGAYPLYPDLDGDGWGADGHERYTCAEAYTQFGYTTQGGDCDDNRYRVNPEGSGCGADFDCDGVPEPDCDDYTPGVVEDFLVLAADRTAFLTGDELIRTEWSGQAAIAAAGEGVQVALPDSTTAKVTISDGVLGAGTYLSLSGAQVADLDGVLLFGGPESLVDYNPAGAFFALDVRSDNGVIQLTSDANIVRMGEGSDGLGTDVAAYDPDALGTPQFLVSAPGSGSVRGFEIIGLDYTEHSRLEGNSGVGTVLAVADLDGDGTHDLAAGSPDESGLWLVAGPLPSGTAAFADNGTLLDGVGGADGSDVEEVGDLDGDGNAEVAVGLDDGHAYIVSGIPSSGALDAHLVLTDAGGETVRASAAGDVDGDGNADLLIGLPDVYRMGVMLGPFDAVAYDIALDRAYKGGDETTSVPPLVGAAQAGLGDLDGDGFDDIAGSTAGYTYVVLGGL